MKTTQPYVPSGNLVDLLLDAICVVDKEGRFVFVSAACERIFGYTAEEMLGRRMIELVLPEDHAITLQAASEIMSGGSKPNFENRYARKDGRIVHIMWSARWSADDQLRIAVAHDVSERKHSESMQAALYAISEAAHLAKDLHSLFEKIHSIVGQLLPAINFSVALYDKQNDQLSFPYHIDERHQAPAPHNLAAPTLSAEIIRTGQTLLLSPETLTTLPEHLQAIDCTSLYWLGVPLTSHNGTIGALVLQSYTHGACYTDKDKELLQFVSTQVAAAIERQQMLSRLQFMAQYDQLTQLPNRALLYDRLHTALTRARRDQTQLSLLFLDLDKFKQVNDTFGHTIGDLLLQLVAERIRQCVRESDTVARLGGDEFVVLLEDFHSPDHALLVAEKIRLALNQPFDLNGMAHLVLPSIGVAFYPQHGIDAQQLLKHADNAMYVAKKGGGNRFQITLDLAPH
ncbi:diguanylate cyclase [Pseudomonas sp. MMS21-TM103]|nr:GGDEF domain-containing protein [Pseudomonas sp. MMS21 TM103]MCG4453959.1 diguanylate cyclase [Pseudomonas sp. MMS21 TM103]